MGAGLHQSYDKEPACKTAPVLAGMLELQRRGYGQAKAIPSIEMAATGIDSVIAITGAHLSHAARTCTL